MDNSNPVGVIYWGTKGGGNRFTFNICMELHESGVPFRVSLSKLNENLAMYQESFPNSVQLIDCETRLPNLIFTYIERISMIEIVIKEFKKSGVQNILVTMPHFLDFSIYKVGKKNSMTLVRVIHDYRRHPGDIWPNMFSILRRRFASDKLLFLSEYVMRKCRFPYRQSTVANFPREFLFSPKKSAQLDEKSSDVLIVGRLRKYKGLRNLEMIVEMVNEVKEVKFLLAGSGKTEVQQSKNLEILNTWLSEIEFEELVIGTRIILLLHEEASQSGVPPLAHTLGKWIVAPNLGGIAEQIEDGTNGFLYESGDLSSASDRILKALNLQNIGIPPSVRNNESFSKSLEKLFE